MDRVLNDPTATHVVFAFLPVLVHDKDAGIFKYVWLKRVERRLVSIQGALHWIYSPYKKAP